MCKVNYLNILLFIASFVGCNSLATLNAAASPKLADIQTISGQQLSQLLIDRAQNLQKQNSQEIYLQPKKQTAGQPRPNKLSASVQEALSYEVYKTTDTDTFLRNPKSGLIIRVPHSTKKELEESSPEFILTHSKAIGESFKSSMIRLAPESIAFYMGVGANHALDLIFKYYDNPMALEQFSEEITDPFSQFSFYMFMVGNQYGQMMMTQALRSSSMFSGALGRQFIGFMSMGLGSLISSMSYDLIIATKSCAEAGIGDNSDYKKQKWEECEASYKKFVTSDTAARYASSVASTMGAAVTSFAVTGGATALASGALNKLAPEQTYLWFRGLTVAWEEVRSFAVATRASTLVGQGLLALASLPVSATAALAGVGIRIGGFVLFLRLSDWYSPYTDYAIEEAFRSAPHLADLRKKLNQSLSQSDITACKYYVENEPSIALAWKGYMPARDALIKQEKENNGQCSPIDNLIRYQDANDKWRTTIEARFLKYYNIWQQYIGEFAAMQLMDYDFLSKLIPWSYAAQTGADKVTSNNFNPFVHDDPFYGVNFPDDAGLAEMTDDQLNTVLQNYHLTNALRSHRVLQSYLKIQDAINYVSKMSSSPRFIKMTLSTLAGVTSDMEKFVNRMSGEQFSKSLVPQYMPNAKVTDYKELVSALKKLNNFYEYMSAEANAIISPNAVGTQIDTDRSAAQIIAWKLREIRNFIGKPIPLAVDNDFIYHLNDYFKQDGRYSSFLYTFEGKYHEDLVDMGIINDAFNEGSATDILVKLSVCGVDADQAEKLNQRRTTWLNKSINAVASWYNASFPMQWNATFPNHQTTWFVPEDSDLESLFHYGTGMDFLVPRVVSNSIEICNRKDIPIRNQNDGKTYTLSDGKSYRSYLDYLLKNLDYQRFNSFKFPMVYNGDDGRDPNSWWQTNVLPKIKNTFTEFNSSYQEMLTKEFFPILDQGFSKQTQDPYAFAALLKNQTNRDSYGNPKNLASAYLEELDTNLQILNNVYTQLIQNPSYQFIETDGANDTLAYQKANPAMIAPSLAAFKRKLSDIKGNMEKILFSIRANYPTIRKPYAKSLVELQLISQTFLIHNDTVLAGIQNVPAIKALDDSKKIPLYKRLYDRVSNQYVNKDGEPSFADIYNSASRDFQSALDAGQDMRPAVVYTLGNENKKFPELALAYVAMNRIFDLFDTAYLNTSIYRRATGEKVDEAIGIQPNKQPGKIIGN